MSNIERVKIAKNDIEASFNALPNKVFKKKELGRVLEENRRYWRLTKNLSTEEFIDILLKHTSLRAISLNSQKYKKRLVRYIWGDNELVYQTAFSIKPNSYFSHYTAVYLHNLTQQIPKTIYLNTEQTKKPKKDVPTLQQENIDRAFRSNPRVSQLIYEYGKWNICCLSGKNTNNLGVEEFAHPEDGKIPVTNIERTLIDITVRPAYSGGVFEVLNAFKAAKNEFSVNKMLAILKEIDYTYPYHQAIGFYLQRAGYKQSLLNLLKKLDIQQNFYLDYNMKKTDYSEEWKLFFPKNF